MKQSQTNRRFYNKWLYKVTVRLDNPNVFRHNSLDVISSNKTMHSDSRRLAKILLSIGDFQLRIERKYIDVYVNERDHYDEIVSNFSSTIKHCFVPHPNLTDQTVSAKDIIAKKLPHDRYRYKVYLKAHAMPDQEKKNYLKWLETQHPRIYLTDNTKDWFIKTSWNWDRRYMYIEDEHTLLLAKMRQGSVLGSIYTYKV